MQDFNLSRCGVSTGQRLNIPSSLMGLSSFQSLEASDESALDVAFLHYQQSLLSSRRAEAYLAERGIFHPKAISELNLGFANRTLGLAIQELAVEEYNLLRGSLERMGLFKSSGHELFNGAITFPIIDIEGDIVGAYGRRVTEKLNSRSVYHVQWLTQAPGFFNIQGAKTHTTIILCKSPVDALSWWMHGFTNALSTLGLEHFSEAHATLLKQLNVSRVILALGTSKLALAQNRLLTRCLSKKGISVQFIVYPDGQDANSFMLSESSVKDGFYSLLKSAANYVEN